MESHGRVNRAARAKVAAIGTGLKFKDLVSILE
jgi:hypothetical protein